MLTFYKYHGTGNDFILIDNLKGEPVQLNKDTVKALCHRRFGIGADGLIIMRTLQGYDFEMVYYNADGNEGSMCGNGGRCIVQFAFDRGIHRYTYSFMASDGPHEAEIDKDGVIRLKMKDVNFIEQHNQYMVLNTGSPHYIKFVNNASDINVFQAGRDIRYSAPYVNEGINVNFVQNTSDEHIFVRTYERGVEDETLSCGTGVTAAALVSSHNDRGFNRVGVKTLGGELSVEFSKTGDTSFENIWLCGPATFVYKGEIDLN